MVFVGNLRLYIRILSIKLILWGIGMVIRKSYKKTSVHVLINRSYALIVSDFTNAVSSWTKFSSISSGSDSPHCSAITPNDSRSLPIGASSLSWNFNFSTYSRSLYDNGVVRFGIYLLSISDFRYVFLLWIYFLT